MKLIGVLPLLLLAFCLRAADDLSAGESTMLQDPGGWEYIAVSDADNGIQTQHTCFDGHPHPEQCSGRLTLHPDNTFVKKLHIHGQSVTRQGQYELSGRQITFIDELGTSDGPYTLDLNTETKKMSLQIRQGAGVLVHADFELAKEYKKRLQNQKH